MSALLQRGWMVNGGILLGGLLALLLVPHLTYGQEFPTKPINIIVNFPPGGSVDSTTRALISKAEKYLGQPFVVLNKAGGGGTVGLGIAAKEKPDGYHLVSCSSAGITWHPQLRDLPYHYQDLVPIVTFGVSHNGIVVRSDAPWKTLNDLLEYSRKNPEKVSFSSPGTQSHVTVTTKYFAKHQGIQWTYVSFPGAVPALTALIGGHVDFFSGATDWAPHVRAGTLRILATFTDKRMKRFPDAPTFQEMGYNLQHVSSPYLVAAPKGTPLPIVKKLESAFQKAMEDEEFVRVLENLEMEPTFLNSEETTKFIEECYEQYGKEIIELNIPRQTLAK